MPTFDTPEPITVSLTLTVADIRLRAGERADTVVRSDRATRPTRRTSARGADPHRVRRRPPGDPRAEAVARARPVQSAGALDIEIELPTGSAVFGDRVIADLHTDGPTRTLRFATSMGDLTVDRTGPRSWPRTAG